MNQIQIDIVSDVACPWCYIGKKHLEKAIEKIDNQNITINWHPFQLDPTIPAEGYDRKEYFEKKFGSEERTQQIYEHVSNVGRKAGIDFQFNAIPRAINTIPLHKILHVAGKEGFQHELEERFFKAMFTDGIDLSNAQELHKIMAEFGWDAAKVDNILADDEIGYHVRQEINHFQSIGVSGVPFFILNNKYGFSGAQPVDVFVNAINQVAAEMQPVEADGEACDIDGGNC